MAMPRIPIAQYLLEKGYVTQAHIDEATKVMQQSKSNDLGKALVELGHLGEREMLEAKAQEEGLTFVDLDRYTIDASAINMVPERIVKNHTVIPVRKEGNVLFVAMPNPNNIQAIDDVRMVSRLDVKPVRAVPEAIEEAIRKHYGSGAGNGSPQGGLAQAMAAAPTPSSNRGDISQAIAEAGAARGLEDEADAAAAAQVAEQAPIIRLANALIQQAIQDRASDVHVEPQQRGVRVRYRVDGVLHEAMTVPKNLQAPLISRYKIMADMNIAERRIPQDGRIEIRQAGKDFDLRVSAIPTPFGEKIVMRILDKTSILLGLEKLGFSEEVQSQIEELTNQPNGMFLSTGPTGAGKTTTQYSVLNRLNSIERNIITIEDPIEYQLNGISQVQVNRKAGLSFANALRSFLRQDPDIIMVGEVRDFETAEIAVKAALTGHLVLSTLHTNDAPATISRLLNMGVEPFLITASVNLVLAQRLARRVCVDCKRPHEVDRQSLRDMGFSEDQTANATIMKGLGCATCSNTGYKGRVALYEVMRFSEDLKEMVLQGASSAELKAGAIKKGMSTLRMSGIRKVIEGMTTPEEIMRVTMAD